MIAFFLSPLYILAIVYIISHFYRMATAFSQVLRKKWVIVVLSVILFFFAATPVLATFLPDIYIRRIIRPLSTYWLGCLLYLMLSAVGIDLLLFLLKKLKVIKPKVFATRRLYALKGVTILAITAAVSTYGFVHAANIKTTTYDIEVQKSCAAQSELKVVLVSDLHLGYSIGLSQMQKMADKINALEPDLVVFAGDIFDNAYDSIADPDEIAEVLSSIDSTYGSYACFGNHDVEENILAGFTVNFSTVKLQSSEMYDFLEKSDITVLRDEAELIANSFYLVGRLDSQKPGTADGRLDPVELMEKVEDTSKPVIVIDHQPRQLEELSDVGVDIDLSGHTHDGQLFPGNIITHLIWDNACGLKKYGNMYSVVTSGVGVYGPSMRVGTDAEVVEINVTFTGEAS